MSDQNQDWRGKLPNSPSLGVDPYQVNRESTTAINEAAKRFQGKVSAKDILGAKIDTFQKLKRNEFRDAVVPGMEAPEDRPEADRPELKSSAEHARKYGFKAPGSSPPGNTGSPEQWQGLKWRRAAQVAEQRIESMLRPEWARSFDSKAAPGPGLKAVHDASGNVTVIGRDGIFAGIKR